MRVLTTIIALYIMLLLTGCGDPAVNLTNTSYNPKIAVEAYMFCGETVKNIKLTRNFALGTPIGNDMYLTPAKNKVSAFINGMALSYDPTTKTYFNDQIVVEYGKTYRLEISAQIDGKDLYTTSTTTTPNKGFTILNKYLGMVKYGTSPADIQFKTSAATDLYIFSIVPDTASIENFIYNNPYQPDIKTSDLEKNFNEFKFKYEILSDLNSYTDSTYLHSLQKYDYWFYSSYTITAYAGDRNFRYYLMTAPNVQEFDGNFHEPIEIFQGDGIGVFASAIRETIRLTIYK